MKAGKGKIRLQIKLHTANNIPTARSFVSNKWTQFLAVLNRWPCHSLTDSLSEPPFCWTQVNLGSNLWVYNSLQDLCADLIEWSVEPASSLRATLETCDLCVNVDISVTVDMSDMSDPTIKEWHWTSFATLVMFPQNLPAPQITLLIPQPSDISSW